MIESAVEQEISYGSPMKKKTAGNSNASGAAAVEPKGKKDKEKTVKKKSKKKKLLSGTGQEPAGEVVASVSTESKVWETLGRSPGSSRAGGQDSYGFSTRVTAHSAHTVYFRKGFCTLASGYLGALRSMSKPLKDQVGWLTIGAVSRASGIPTNTLRTWERRYGFPEPRRTEGGHRLYPKSVVEHLIAIRQALAAGRRPGQVVGAPMSELCGPGSIAKGSVGWLESYNRGGVVAFRQWVGNAHARLGK